MDARVTRLTDASYSKAATLTQTVVDKKKLYTDLEATVKKNYEDWWDMEYAPLKILHAKLGALCKAADGGTVDKCGLYLVNS